MICFSLFLSNSKNSKQQSLELKIDLVASYKFVKLNNEPVWHEVEILCFHSCQAGVMHAWIMQLVVHDKMLAFVPFDGTICMIGWYLMYEKSGCIDGPKSFVTSAQSYWILLGQYYWTILGGGHTVVLSYTPSQCSLRMQFIACTCKYGAW